MAECNKSTQKEGVPTPSNSSISNILSILSSIFSIMKQPADFLPPPLLFIGAKMRPGLSARDMAARVISRFSESDAVNAQIFQEGNNVMTALEVIRMEEIVSAIQTEAKITTVIDPGTIIVKSAGTCLGILPVVVEGTNLNIPTATGVMQ